MFLTAPVMQTAKMQSVSPWLLSLGLVFSVATQLRLPGLPLGLGEVLLLLWLLTTVVSAKNWHNPALTGVLALTLVSALLLSAGYFLMVYPEGHSRPPALHDTLAYVFCAVLAINYARLSDKYENDLPAMLLWAFLMSAMLALVLGVIGRDWSGMDVMYHHMRWQHLSDNPNQFALLVLFLPFLALHLILRQSEKQSLLMPTLLGLLALGLGWYSQSDALTLAWVGGGLVAALALSGERPKRSIPPQPPAPYARLIAALLVLLMVAGSAWQWRDVAAQVILGTGTKTGGCSNLMGTPKTPINDDQNQVGIRLCLWHNALVAIQYSPLTGMGPGPHSGFIKPFDGEEAHNSLLDWGTQAGLVGVAALVGYLTWLLWQVMRRRHYELVAMLLALYCFAMFHLMLRQPLFWIVPLLALQLALRSDASVSDATPNNEIRC
jgi:O-antigen ligase